MSQEPVAKQVFISYAPKDDALGQRLDTHLSLIQRQGVIASWHDRHVQAGTDWAKEIDTHLEEASVILLASPSSTLYTHGLFHHKKYLLHCQFG